VLVVIALAITIAAPGGGTTYHASADGGTVINPADLAVAVHVANMGKKAGTPSCTIQAQDPSGAYSGVDVATLKGSMAPGATTTFVDNLTITKEGAQYVTDVSVKCS
jgi:hypothetical protein